MPGPRSGWTGSSDGWEATVAQTRWRYEVLQDEETGVPVNVLASDGPVPGVVMFSHRRKVWEDATGRAQARAVVDLVEGTSPTRRVDRTEAETAAARFGQTLPDESALTALLTGAPTA